MPGERGTETAGVATFAGRVVEVGDEFDRQVAHAASC
jgi:hypothetical protein